MSEPRIPPRPSADWDAEVNDALSSLRSPNRSLNEPPPERKPGTPVNNIIGVLSWHPALTKAFFGFNNHLFHSTLSPRDREMVTVRVSWLRRGEYEWAQHIKMAQRFGMTDEEIDAISVGPGAPVWGARDVTLLTAVDEIVADRYVSDETWQALEKFLDRKQLMDLVFTIGAYDMLAMALNTFGLQLDPGLTGFPPVQAG